MKLWSMVSLVVLVYANLSFTLPTSATHLGDPFLTKLYNFYGNRTKNLINRYPYLLNKTNGHYIGPKDYLDVNVALRPSKEYLDRVDAEQFLYEIERTVDFVNRIRRDHSYSNLKMMTQAGQPVADRQLCYRQIEQLQSRLINDTNSLFERGRRNRQLLQYLDSFGKPESSIYLGNTFWLGSYYDCLSAWLDMSPGANETQENSTRTRYCVGKLRGKSWPNNDTMVPKTSIKIGLCLPESCDTVAFYYDTTYTNGQLLRRPLEDMMRLNFAPIYADRYDLVDMYCLPDERSPLRQWSISTYAYFSLCSAWILLVLLASLIYHFFRAGSRTDHQAVIGDGDFINMNRIGSKTHQPSDSGGASTDESINSQTSLVMSQIDEVISGMESRHLRRLQGGAKRDSSEKNLTIGQNHNQQKTNLFWEIVEALAIEKTIEGLARMTRQNRRGQRVNLGALNFIKIVSTILVVIVHTSYWKYFLGNRSSSLINYFNSFTFHIVLNNVRAVDTFFVIAGLLFGYLTMKEYSRYSIDPVELLKPSNWLKIQMIKYLRVAPVFLLVYWYSKSLAVYTGKGPIWDYGTDSVSFRAACLNEEWFKFILYFGNFGSDVIPWCSEVSWYLVIYVQIFLVLPFVMYLVCRYPYSNILIVALIAAISFLLSAYKRYTQDIIDTSGFVLLPFIEGCLDFKYLFSDYSSPVVRITPAVFGLLGGYFIHQYERSQVIRWPWFMRGFCFASHIVSLFVLSVAAALPKIPFLEHIYMDWPKLEWLNVAMPLICQSGFPLFVVLIIMRLVTDLADANVITRLMSHKFWAVFNEFTFSIYLIHYEVIYYGLTIDNRMEDAFNDYIIIRESAWVLLLVSVLSLFVYILYEAPINKLVKLFGPSSRRHQRINHNIKDIRS